MDSSSSLAASAQSRAAASAGPPHRLPLHELHVRRGGKMAPFAGYEMPMQYGPGVLKEHLHTRSAASLFDVSHMGQLLVRTRSGSVLDAAHALESLLPADLVSLAPGRQRYALLTSDSGGILDDLMVAHLGTHFLLVVNASRKAADEAHLRLRIAAVCQIEALDNRVLLALQGPKACAALSELAPSVRGMRFMDAALHRIQDVPCIVTRSGYTGEDGFEISAPVDAAQSIVLRLLENPDVALAGLGARDSLRLEAGLCLYGSDLGPDTTPVEAALEWSIQRSRRTSGARAGGFPGAQVILRQLEEGATRRRVGFRADTRPVRAGAPLYLEEIGGSAVGTVTSGGFGPSLNAPVAMGYMPAALGRPGTRLFAEIRDQRYPVTVTAMPFVEHRYPR